MNWSSERVVEWCKSFIDDEGILFQFKGQTYFFKENTRFFLYVCNVGHIFLADID